MKKIYIGFGLIAGILLPMIAFPLLGYKSGEKYQMNMNIILLMSLFMGSILSMWAWMLIDLFKRKNVKLKFVWGFFFLTAIWPTSVIYFLAVYFPRERPGKTEIAGTSRRKQP